MDGMVPAEPIGAGGRAMVGAADQRQEGGAAPAAARSALNAICPYYTMFPLAFPLAHLSRAPPETAVLDPFCGRGTTLFAARTQGLSSLGVDSNPVAVAISRAKLSSASPRAVASLARALVSTTDPDPVPEGEFWTLAFAPRTLDALLRLRAGLRGRGGAVADALRAVVLGALHGPCSKHKHSYLSNQMPRTFASKPAYSVRFWRSHGLRAPEVDVVAVVAERAERYFGAPSPPPGPGRALLGDARKVRLPRRRFSMVVTSPPYFGMRSYVPDQWVRSWFLGGPSTPEYVQAEQIGFGTPATFAAELGRVWANIAPACTDGATLAIRFGALRSRPCDPLEVARASLAVPDAGWAIVSTSPAGDAHAGKRQAEQMGYRAKGSSAVDEHDIVCKLERKRRLRGAAR